jgi:hypothetical protein
MTIDINKGGVPPQFMKPGDKDDEKDKKKPGEKDEAEKGGELIHEETLLKSLDKVAEIVKGSPEARKQELFAKGGRGGLSPDEEIELSRLMAGTHTRAVSDSVNKSLDPSAQGEGFTQSIRVNEYLEGLHGSLSKAMQDLAEHVEKSDSRSYDRTIAIAKGVLDIGTVVAKQTELLKALDAKLGVVMQQPVRGPKAVTAQAGGQPMEKSLGGQQQQPQGMALSKAAVLDILTEMNEHSKDGLSKSGEPLVEAITKYEQLDMISPQLAGEVRQHFLSTRANGHAHAR